MREVSWLNDAILYHFILKKNIKNNMKLRNAVLRISIFLYEVCPGQWTDQRQDTPGSVVSVKDVKSGTDS